MTGRMANRGAPMSHATTHTMLWGSLAGVSAGVGVEQRTPSATTMASSFAAAAPVQARTTPDMLLGLAVSTGQRSQLVLKAPLRRNDDQSISAQPERPLRLGLSFQSRDPYAELRKGALMRIEISGPTVFSLRPRHGHLAMVVTSNW